MGKPRDAVCLAATGRVLNEVVAARPFASCRYDQLPHRVKLMVARENHLLIRDPTMPPTAVIHFFLFLFEKHEVAENIEEAFELKHLLPEVTCAIARLMDWISCTTDDLAGVTSAIEWQE